MELLEVGSQLEEILEQHPLPKERLATLLIRRQKLLDDIGEPPNQVAKILWAQNDRLIQKCKCIKESLGLQIGQLKEQNERKRLSGASSRYFDGRC